MKEHEPVLIPNQWCAQCKEPATETSGGELIDPSSGDVRAYVHHACKEEWLRAHNATSFDAIERPGKTRKPNWLLLAIVLFVSSLFGIFVWPTPYQYELIHQGNSVRTGRIARWNSSRVRFLSRYGCWVGDNEVQYACLSKERQNQIALKARAEAQAQRDLGSFSNEREVAADFGILLVQQAGKRLKWSDIERQISADNDFDEDSKQEARNAAWNEMQATRSGTKLPPPQRVSPDSALPPSQPLRR